ncbi:lysozyme inhibitor LprI family protein [Acinetobacter sp. ANC 4973]|uniref:lysozyme inhibitor LprI family protein n=1 Tax=Acinetobacter sp. ANC 4973 TaxID=1977871 RepID=UPI000A33CDE1|nr:lysozyme inhibitor LprI family protein [Acinetobacter sp. ANC 4973]OTG97689.1 hypothetical protein B9T30_13670 [Acinetobacter sp. ANC 4973]
MRFGSAIFGCIIALGSSTAFANGYSAVYTQCLNKAYGDLEIIKKCVSTEQEKQNKLLKKYYEKVLENNTQHMVNIKQQRQLWQNQVEQRCYSALKSDFGKIRQAKCQLEMTMNQVGYYQSKQLGLS